MVGNIRYFKCKSRRGLFLRRSKIVSFDRKCCVTTVRCASRCEYVTYSFFETLFTPLLSPIYVIAAEDMPRVGIGDLVKVYARNRYVIGRVRYLGSPNRTKGGVYYGLQLRKAYGDTDGQYANTRYFKCNKNCGLFVKSSVHITRLGSFATTSVVFPPPPPPPEHSTLSHRPERVREQTNPNTTR